MIDLDTAFAALGAVKTTPLFVMQIGVDRIHAIGGPDGVDRRVGELAAGHFVGARLAGAVIAGGADWQSLRSDGTVVLDARVVLRTDDDALIAMTYDGIRSGPADVLQRLGRGEPVDSHSYYFRIVARFTTSAPRYDWLNRIIAIGIGHRLPAGPIYSLYEIA